MDRRIFAVWASLFILSSFIVIITENIPPVKAAIITVDDSGGADYTRIWDAIAAANNGDTVFVHNGIYNEWVNVNKTINLVGEDKNSTIIIFENADVILVQRDWVNITGFTITANSSYNAGIYLDGVSNTRIYNNTISKNYYGIYAWYSDNNTITDNEISYNNHTGILFESSNDNDILQNNISFNNNGISCDGNRYYIVNNNVSQNMWMAIRMDYSKNIDVINNTILDNYQSGIFSSECENINIIDNTIMNTEWWAIRISMSNWINVSNNVISNNTYGIYLSSASYVNLTLNNFTKDGVILGGSVPLHYSSHYIPVNNLVNNRPLYYYMNLNGMTMDGIPVGQLIFYNCIKIDVRNLSINNTDIGIQIIHCSNVSINRNNISENLGSIQVTWSDNCTISDNNIYANEEGIYVTGYDNNITENMVSHNNGKGILIGGSNNRIVGNNVSFNSEDGINLYNSHDNHVLDNNIFNNGIGLHLKIGMFVGSNRNNISGNNISYNTFGIFLMTSSYNRIYRNIISNNEFGLNISEIETWSVENLIFHNQFLNNTYQASEHLFVSDNYWDHGYPIGGNFWSDYNGTDQFKGPYQNIPGSDGIGDTPYPIYSDDQDNYPLINPDLYRIFENFTILRQGWNFISIPLIQGNQTLSKVLEMIDGYYDAVQWFDITDETDPWKNYVVGKPFGNDLTHLNETMGFWVHINQSGETIFLYNGTPPTSNQTIPLHPGWNMVGYPSMTNKTRDIALNNLTFGVEVDALWTFDASTQKWKEIGPLDSFELGRGYWIHATQECEWEVPL